MAFARLVGAAEQHIASGGTLTQGRGRSVKKAAEDASAAIEAVEDFAEGSMFLARASGLAATRPSSDAELQIPGRPG